MAAADGGRKKLDGLLGKLLTHRDPLGRSQRLGLAMVVFALFAVQLTPLGLVTWLQ
jgi:hypothetical protein